MRRLGLRGALRVFAVYAALFAGLAQVLRAQTGVVLNLSEGPPGLAICPLGMVAGCALGGVIAAWKAYRTPVAETIAPVS